MKNNILFGFAALSAALAIAAGAFGAHGAIGPAVEWLKTGALYQLCHAIAVLVLIQTPSYKNLAMMLLIGAALFSGSLYLMAFGAPRILGAVTPIGGALMIFGWLWIAYRAFRQRSE
ncbi:MAG: DUF423 domain-containing protein [Chakrabartia sp.]